MSMSKRCTPRKTRTCRDSFPPFLISPTRVLFSPPVPCHYPLSLVPFPSYVNAPRTSRCAPHTILRFLVGYLDMSTYDAHNDDSLFVLGIKPSAKENNDRPLRDRLLPNRRVNGQAKSDWREQGIGCLRNFLFWVWMLGLVRSRTAGVKHM